MDKRTDAQKDGRRKGCTDGRIEEGRDAQTDRPVDKRTDAQKDGHEKYARKEGRNDWMDGRTGGIDRYIDKQINLTCSDMVHLNQQYLEGHI